MDRRRFLESALLGGAALIVPGTALAAKRFDPLTSPMAGAVYYTKKRPGRWSQNADSHLPLFERKGNALQVRTRHEMRGFAHYIVKHILFDRNFRMIGEKTFEPGKDWPVSVYDITNMRGPLYAMSVCNLHDSWLAGIRL